MASGTTTTTAVFKQDDDDGVDKEYEDPSLSSASLCITFHTMGEIFRPVFTHQAFPGEWIRGYHPPLKTLLKYTLETEDEKSLHSSHKNHEVASKELTIDIHLAPSCDSCRVSIQIEKKRLPRRQSLRTSKRRRLEEPKNDDVGKTDSENNDGEDDDEKGISSSPSEHDVNGGDNSDSEFEDVDETSENGQDDDQEGPTRRRRMPTKEILSCLEKGLPTVQDETVKDNFLRRPLGIELKEYSVGDKDFCLSLASGTEAAKYHSQVQRLALWFIETADDVDVSCLEGGFWKVLYLFRRHKKAQFSLAGYITLFHFHAPFKKPKPGYVVRICQALVLPHYQRCGHGKKLLSCVFDIAHGKYQHKIQEKKEDEIVEINVESPAPAFVLLRNRVDYECFLHSIDAKDAWIPSLIDEKAKIADPGFFTSVPDSEIVKAAAKARIVPRQIQIVQELFKLSKLQRHLQTKPEGGDQLEKQFRLMVKKRLNKEHSEDLGGLRTKADKQAFLEDAFQKCLKSYAITIPKED